MIYFYSNNGATPRGRFAANADATRIVYDDSGGGLLPTFPKSSKQSALDERMAAAERIVREVFEE